MNLVFVYGTLMRGGRLHGVLTESRYCGNARLRGYTMFDLGWFPGIVRSGGHGEVHGEVYEVDDDTLANLDRIEGTPHLYQRKAVKVLTRKGSKFLQAQAYIFNGTPPEEDRVPGGWWPRGGGSRG